jgi:GntR family transcriptional regulator, phosphonate transport system regulatory protein
MRSPRVVIWQRIAEVLAAEISSGTVAAGARLPTETALAQRFGVNRHTLRQAVGALSAAGLVSVQHGRGTFARPAPIVEYPLGARTRYSEILSRQSLVPDGELLAAREMTATAEAAEALALPPDSSVIVLEILRRANGQPLSLVTTYVPALRFRGIDAAFRESNSITAAFRAFGVVDYTRRSTRIWTRMPTPEEAVLLRQRGDAPVLIMEAVNQDEHGEAIEYGISRAAGQRLQVLVAN